MRYKREDYDLFLTSEMEVLRDAAPPECEGCDPSGPHDDPLTYLDNLRQIVNSQASPQANQILDFQTEASPWNPVSIRYSDDFSATVIPHFKHADYLIVQGPPGTGKTYRIAQLIARLLTLGHSVLATSLTNRALMEIALKRDLSDFVSRGLVGKANLTPDERRELPQLDSIDAHSLPISAGNLSLATFCVASSWAKSAPPVPPFDYVIMDEASQALLPMIAASVRLGKKVVWIGDQKQLPPVTVTPPEVIARNNWEHIVNGFTTICHHQDFHTFLLSDTLRLTPRGARFTGIFYANNLRSVSSFDQIPSSNPILHKDGGPVLVTLPLAPSDLAPQNTIDFICRTTSELLDEKPAARIAILTKHAATALGVRASLQHRLGDLPKKLKIATVDKVQGLTVDYAFYLIPRPSALASLEERLFNVATSRAKFNTIIVADGSLLDLPVPLNVGHFLRSLSLDRYSKG